MLINITEEWALGGASGNNVQQTEQDRGKLGDQEVSAELLIIRTYSYTWKWKKGPGRF